MAKLKVSLSIGYANATIEDVIEIDDDELADCTTDYERDSLCWDYTRDWMNNYIDYSFELVEE